MKRKKVITVTVLAMTFATMMASCGKATETVNAESVQATEQIVLETETEEIPQVSADQGEGTSLTLEPTMVDGKLVYPDYPEEIVKYTPIDPVELWVIKQTNEYNNPNATNGELITFGMSITGTQIKVDATCELDGISYYRIVPINNDNQYLIIEQSSLSDTPPEEITSSTATTVINDKNYPTPTPEEMAQWDKEIEEEFGGAPQVEDLPYIPAENNPGLDSLPDDVLDAASRLEWQ